MPWCPKCRLEYQPGFTECSDCETGLVDTLEPTEDKDSKEYDKEVYLTSAANSLEAEVIERLLESNGIPVLKKYRGAGAYLEIYMGMSNFRIDLYVPSKALDIARGIITSKPETGEEINATDTAEGASKEAEFEIIAEKNRRKRAITTWIIILVFFPGLLFIVLSNLIALISWILNIFSR